MLASILLTSASANNFAVSVEVFESSDSSCEDRVLRVAVEADICKLSPESCAYVPNCEDLNSLISSLEDSDPNLAGKLPKFGECFPISSLTDLIPSSEGGDSDNGSLFRRLAATPEGQFVSELLDDVTSPVIARNNGPHFGRRRQTIPEIPDMSTLPFGDVMLKCGGANIGSMSAGASAGITATVFFLIIGATCGVMLFAYKAGYRFVAPEANGEQEVEMDQTTTPKGQTKDTAKGETEQV